MKNISEQLNATFHNIIAPATISAITTINPLIGTPLLVAYGFFGVSMQYKQKEVNDFVQILIDNPGIFTKEITSTKEFQDGFIIIFEKYIKERNKEKRKIIKDIFLGFTNLSEEEKEKFELEKLLLTSSNIGFEELNILKNIHSGEQKPILFSQSSMGYGKGFKTEQFDNFKYLESLGILIIHLDIDSIEREIMEGDSEESFRTGQYETDVGTTMHFEVTRFGETFISYLLKNES